MTFVIAKIIDHNAGKVSLLADTKLTDRNNEALTRRTLGNPCEKVVIVNDDVVVAFAGDTPELALRKVVGTPRTGCGGDRRCTGVVHGRDAEASGRRGGVARRCP